MKSDGHPRAENRLCIHVVACNLLALSAGGMYFPVQYMPKNA
jgi:hypothetical protein